MRVLVTGSSGHVGGAIATHLAAAGWEVIGLGRRQSAVGGFVQQVQADVGSVAIVDQIQSVVSPCDAIVHAAATLAKDLHSPSLVLTNCLGTQQMLRLANLWQAHSFVYISSVPVIGLPQQLPITEEHPTKPLTVYHATKLFGEYLASIAQSSGLAAASLRLTSPIGPGMPPDRILSVFVKRAIADQPLQLVGQGTRRQNYVDVRDVAVAVKTCLQRGVTGLFNVAGRQSISNYDLAKLCVHTLRSSSLIQFVDRPDLEEGIIWDVSVAKAAIQFGYNPNFTIEDSVRSVAADYAYCTH